MKVAVVVVVAIVLLEIEDVVPNPESKYPKIVFIGQSNKSDGSVLVKVMSWMLAGECRWIVMTADVAMVVMCCRTDNDA